MLLTRKIGNFITATTKRTLASTMAKTKESNLDPLQEAAMNERCFLVDENDEITGTASKKECHTVSKTGDVLLHRAFSVFLFNKKGDLLLQKRSSMKITYPDCYTNSCCSHPIADVPGEDEETNALGIKRAVQRRLNYELGIPVDSIPLEKLDYITRIIYKDEGNGRWGEHEIDYVIFFQGDLHVKANPNEISEISYVPRNELDQYIPTLNGPLTPWFQLILKHRLKLWWDNLENISEIRDHEKILRFKS